MSRTSFVKTRPISEFSVTAVGFGHRFEWLAKWFNVLFEPSGFGLEFHCNYIILIYVKDTMDYFWEGKCFINFKFTLADGFNSHGNRRWHSAMPSSYVGFMTARFSHMRSFFPGFTVLLIIPERFNLVYY